MPHSWIQIAGIPFLILAGQLSAQDLTGSERTFFDSHIAEFVQIIPKRMMDPAVKRVFSAPLYDVQVVLKEGDGESRSSLILARIGDRLVNVTRPGSDADMPDFMKMLNPEFRLHGVESAALFQQALDVAYPIIGSGDQKAKTFMQEGNRWIFVRGLFFKDRLGFIVETDGSGRIKSMKFVLKLP
jgi:hypothetical protein